jgi:predicted nucleic-acid-binding protein
MIGLDANVLLRLIVGDDPAQAKAAREFASSRLSAERPGYVSLVALAELVWTLRRGFKYGRSDIASAVESLLSAETLLFERAEVVVAALVRYKELGGLDLPDLIIAVGNAENGCTETVTFDRDAAKVGVMTLLADGA